MPFSSSYLYIGFFWDLAKTVELPAEKKTKYLDRLLPWLTLVKQSLDHAETLIGTLNHVCLVVPAGRSHLVNLYGFRASFKESRSSSFVQHSISSKLRDDLQWWHNYLSRPFVGLDIIKLPPMSDIELFVDASTGWGIGLVLNSKWLAWELKDGWDSNPDRHIRWAEMVAIELAIGTLISSGHSRIRMCICSDNKGVVGALKKGCSRGPEINLILRKIIELMQEHEIWVECIWVSTHDNPADDPSRGVLGPRKLMLAHPPAIPRHLRAFVNNSITPNDPHVNRVLQI